VYDVADNQRKRNFLQKLNHFSTRQIRKLTVSINPLLPARDFVLMTGKHEEADQ